MIYFLILIGILITVHELGHFLLARWVGIRVVTFSIGFGPKLFSWKRGETEYRLALLPFGGYVKMEGDDPGEEIPPDRRAVSFLTAPLWKRTLVVLAGPGFNFLLPFLILPPLFLTVSTLPPARVGSVNPDGPAWKGGVRAGDRIVSILGEPVRYWHDVPALVGPRPGQTLPVQVERAGQVLDLQVTTGRSLERTIPGVLEDEVGVFEIANVYAKPRLHVRAGTPADRAGLRSGDVARAVEGQRIVLFEDLSTHLNEPGVTRLRVDVLRTDPGAMPRGPGTSERDAVDLGATLLTGWLGALTTPAWARPVSLELTRTAGQDWGVLSSEFEVDAVDPASVAAKVVGLQKGDLILKVDGRAFGRWIFVQHHFLAHADEPHTLTFERAGQVREVPFKLERVLMRGEFNVSQERLRFGASTAALPDVVSPLPNEHRIAYAWDRTLEEIRKVVRVTLFGLGGLIVGKVPLREMGGPILIAQVASRAGEQGLETFLAMLVWISVNLGFINLLPIPVLDGGHLMVFGVEAVRRRPLSLKARQAVAYVGLAIILSLTVLVFTNDILRNWEAIRGFFGG